MSRTPVREALQQLAVQNLVRIAPRVGVFVSRPPSPNCAKPWSLAELEAIAAKFAARRMDDSQRAELRALARSCEQASAADDGKQFGKANAAFHELIYDASRNEYLSEQIKSMRRLMQRYRPKIFGSRAQRQRVLGEHQTLVDAILRGDEAAAQEAMLHHAPLAPRARVLLMPSSYPEGRQHRAWQQPRRLPLRSARAPGAGASRPTPWSKRKPFAEFPGTATRERERIAERLRDRAELPVRRVRRSAAIDAARR